MIANETLFEESLKIVKLLFLKEYDQLQKNNCSDDLTIETIKEILKDYGGTLDAIDRDVEDNYRNHFEVIPLFEHQAYYTYLDLQIDGERSDLTLICEISTDGDNILKTTINDLHML